MKEQILSQILKTISALGIEASEEQKSKITVTNPDSKLGDFATNAALILSREAKMKPLDLAQKIAESINPDMFEKVEAVAPGFINFRIKNSELIKSLISYSSSPISPPEGKILLEYFQPNIAKPLHIGHLRTAIIGDSLKRMMKFAGYNVESDTHMGDWGTQFGYLILAYKQNPEHIEETYVKLNADESVRETAKQEFVKLEQGNAENRKIWKMIVDESIQKFLEFEKTFKLDKFENNWPESFYEDKMPAVLDQLREKSLLKESQGAQIVDLEEQKLGVAIIVKSDGGTTYLLRDLATFIFCQQQGFDKHLYVVDNRQSHHYHQLFGILKLMGEITETQAEHIDYGFISFKGAALSTRKGNMVLAEDVLTEAKRRVVKIIDEKNSELPNKEKVVDAVAIGAIKYFDLSHNRHSDYEFDWEQALDFEGNSGPYLQYAYARLSGILSKVNIKPGKVEDVEISETERALIIKLSALSDVVAESLKDYLPNLLANYIFELAGIINKFYHESPVMKEEDENLKNFRLALIQTARQVLGAGLNLLGIEPLDEM